MKDQEKKNIRKVAKERRKNLSPNDCRESDHAIFQQLQKLKEIENADTIFCYVGTEGEVDTKPLISFLLKQRKRVCVPRCISDGIMNAYEITSLEQLQPGKYGIEEPSASCRQVGRAEIDLAIVPCLTCTLSGERLGYGGGYYDRFLADAEIIKVILCREALLADSVPVDEHDIIMDIIVTENGSRYTN